MAKVCFDVSADYRHQKWLQRVAFRPTAVARVSCAIHRAEGSNDILQDTLFKRTSALVKPNPKRGLQPRAAMNRQ